MNYNNQLEGSTLGEEQIYSVTELTQSIGFVLEGEFNSIWVSGEISNFRVPGSGHAYFVLKDTKSQIRCILFRGEKRFIAFEPEEGMEVLVHGSITVYGQRGEYQIIVSAIEPKGKGALQVAFEQLKEKLLKEGLFNKERKRELPEFPERVGVVTSPTGAAVRDIIKVITRRYPAINILLYPVKVQGDGAAKEIAEGINYFNSKESADVLIVGRGGGSIEDLWAFNEEIVARAIFNSKIPVISAVGHEIDFTIADFVADHRASTPSSAGEMAVKDVKEVKKSLRSCADRMVISLTNKIQNFQENIKQISMKRVLKSPLTHIHDLEIKIDDYQIRVVKGVDLKIREYKLKTNSLSSRLYTLSPSNRINQSKRVLGEFKRRLFGTTSVIIRARENRIKELAGRLNSLSPLSVLGRGYSICFSSPKRRPLYSSSDTSVGDMVDVKLYKGELCCKVLQLKD